ncbi:MAG: DUF1552 domain-containing protein [Myxococcota bacterium]|nr:DUF1552 domain-containing protein [Myxococcota bacterium]
MNRRQFMAAMGISSGSLFLPSLSRNGWAAEKAPPQRLLVFFSQHGAWYDGWKMRWDNTPEHSPWQEDLTGLYKTEFSDALAPLHRHRDRMVVIDGLALVSAEADISGVRHAIGQVHSLTGGNARLINGVPFATRPSIDQVISQHVAQPGRYRSLEFGVGDPPASVVYGNTLQPLPFEADARAAHQRLFGTVANSSSDDITGIGQQSVLDLVQAQYSDLEARLSLEDRQKVAVHKELVRELETRIDSLSSLECDTEHSAPEYSTAYFDNLIAYAGIISTAFSCDLTRVITLHMGELPTGMVSPGYTGSLHDDFAHQVYDDAYAAEMMTRHSAIHADQLGILLDALEAIPEGNGSVLDNTLVAWVGELGDPAHGFEHWPVVLFGGTGIRTGRYLYYPSNTPFEGWAYSGELPTMGVPHQKLLVSLAQSMGLDTNVIGETSLTGSDGSIISCTGPLSELL